MLPKQVVDYAQLRRQGLKKDEITSLSASLKIFPTPFKGIYYVPLEIERKGGFIEKPLKVLTQAIEFYIGTKEFYYSCSTAEEFWGIRWQPSGQIHIVNERISKRIELRERIKRNERKGTYRAKRIARLLSFYGDELIFHRTTNVGESKVKETIYGKFAFKSQIKKDRGKFRCR